MANSRRVLKKFLDTVSRAHYVGGMKTDTAPSLPTERLKNSLEEVRASVAGQETNKGLAGVVQEVMLSFLNLLMTLLEDFRAGRLVPVAPSACEESASDNGVSAAGPRRARQSDAKWLGLWEWWRGKSEVPQEPECEDEAPTPVLRGSAGEGGRRERRGCAPLTLPLSRAPPSPSRGEGFKLSLTLAADQVRGRAVPRGAQDSVRNRHDRRGGRPGVIPGGRPPDFAAVGSRRRRRHPGYEDAF
jgi:hypothetical protein